MESDLCSSILVVRYKFVFVGDMGVGKTSILSRFIKNEFNEEYEVYIYIIYIVNNRSGLFN